MGTWHYHLPGSGNSLWLGAAWKLNLAAAVALRLSAGNRSRCERRGNVMVGILRSEWP